MVINIQIYGGIHCIFSVCAVYEGEKTSLSAGIVPFHCSAVTLLPKVPDRNIKVTVNGGDGSQQVPLNFGDTMVEISVRSADGSNSQVG